MAPTEPSDLGRDPTNTRRRGPRWPRGFGVIVVSSAMLFGIAALLVGGGYLVVSSNLRSTPEEVYGGSAQIMTPYGTVKGDINAVTPQEFRRRITSRTLDQLRDFCFLALGILFIASLGISWLLVRMASTSIARITKAVHDIQANDLGNRMLLRGPEDQPWHRRTVPD